MDISLFGQGFTLTLSALSAALLMYVILTIKPAKNRLIVLPILFVIGIGLAFLTRWTTGSLTQSSSELPPDFLVYVVPSTFSILLLIYLIVAPIYSLHKKKQAVAVEAEEEQKAPKKKKRTRKQIRGLVTLYATASLGTVSCILLSLALVNSYYHFYPTLYTALGIYQKAANYNGLEEQLNVADNQANPAALNHQSVEAALEDPVSKNTDGTLYQVKIPGTISGFKARPGWVYVPAIERDTFNKLNLPVLVLLAGVPGSPNDWINSADLMSTLNAFAATHHGITPLVVVADDTGSTWNDTECVNSPRGNVETYLTEDVPTYIKSHFAVSSNPANWAIGGLSMGGTCSVMLSLLHPNVYSYFMDIAGELGPSVGSTTYTTDTLFHGSKKAWATDQPLLLMQAHKYRNVGGFFATARDDTRVVTKGTKRLYLASKVAGMDTVLDVTNGNHTFSTFSIQFKTALPLISNRIGATECKTIDCIQSSVTNTLY